jgi:diguanylate cyclase (GGDEF)-like protein
VTKFAVAWRPLLLVLPPVVALATALSLEITGPGVTLLSGTLLACTIVAAAIAVWVGWFEARLIRLRQRSAERLAATQRESEHLAEEVRRLRTDVDQLAAAREIGLVVNADNEFEEVLDKVSRVVADLLPTARRAGGEFSTQLATADVDRTNVIEALEARRLLRVTVDGVCSITLPLIVEGQAIGVLRAVVDLDDHDAARGAQQALDCEHGLKSIQRHLALAIKAPTLYDRAVRDALTGLYSRRHLDNQLADFIQIARRTGKPVSVVLSDVDHFKAVNDNHGHQAGDYVLHEVGAILRQTIRGYDTAYRYGGEELVVLMPDTDLDDAMLTAERIRSAIETHHFDPPGGKRRPRRSRRPGALPRQRRRPQPRGTGERDVSEGVGRGRYAQCAATLAVSGASITPRSVMRPVMRCAGVTSKAGFHASTPSGMPPRPLVATSSRARCSMGMRSPDASERSKVESGAAT